VSWALRRKTSRDAVRKFGSAHLSRAWGAIAPPISLLPILGAYFLIYLANFSALTAPGDEYSYLFHARNLTHGFYADTHNADAYLWLWHGPGLPGLLAPLVALHVPVEAIRVFTGIVLIFASIVVFHKLVRRYVGHRTALWVTYGLALYIPFLTTVGTVHVEPLATLCFTLAVYLMVRSFHGGRHDHLWAGVALAILALSRVEYGWVLPVALLLSGGWMLAARGSLPARRSAVATGLALVLCTPWLAYTYSLTSRPFYWGNSGGLSLYWMSQPTLGEWHNGRDVFKEPQLAAYRPLFTNLQRLKPLDQDARLQHLAFQSIKEHPTRYLSNVVNNIGRLVFDSPYGFKKQKASFMFYAVPNALLLGILAVALFVAIRVRRRLAPEILPAAVLVALGFAIHVPVAAYPRFIIPLVPAAAWLGVAVLARHVKVVPSG
jgi:4-amino-4-deoxy-L-arabinose transferase-like glycosyltransferase